MTEPILEIVDNRLVPGSWMFNLDRTIQPRLVPIILDTQGTWRYGGDEMFYVKLQRVCELSGAALAFEYPMDTLGINFQFTILFETTESYDELYARVHEVMYG